MFHKDSSYNRKDGIRIGMQDVKQEDELWKQKNI